MTNQIAGNGWHIWSSRGTVLFHIAAHPGCTVQEIADELSLTQRTVWGAVGALRRANMLQVDRRGRRHFYRVNMDATFRAPSIDGVTLRTLFSDLPGEPAAESSTEAPNGSALSR